MLLGRGQIGVVHTVDILHAQNLEDVMDTHSPFHIRLLVIKGV